MTSNIISTTIDETYPVAGVDNDTQGFRDNFNIIKTNFAAAKAEIDALQASVVLKTSLSEDSTVDNDLLGNAIVNAELLAVTDAFDAIGTVITGMNISFSNGHYQTLTLANQVENIQFALADWPATDRHASMRVELLSAGGLAKAVTWTVEGGGTIKYSSNWPTEFLISDSINPIVVEFWTYDAGDTVFANYIGQFV